MVLDLETKTVSFLSVPLEPCLVWGWLCLSPWNPSHHSGKVGTGFETENYKLTEEKTAQEKTSSHTTTQINPGNTLNTARCTKYTPSCSSLPMTCLETQSHKIMRCKAGMGQCLPVNSHGRLPRDTRMLSTWAVVLLTHYIFNQSLMIHLGCGHTSPSLYTIMGKMNPKFPTGILCSYLK